MQTRTSPSSPPRDPEVAAAMFSRLLLAPPRLGDGVGGLDNEVEELGGGVAWLDNELDDEVEGLTNDVGVGGLEVDVG